MTEAHLTRRQPQSPSSAAEQFDPSTCVYSSVQPVTRPVLRSFRPIALCAVIVLTLCLTSARQRHLATLQIAVTEHWFGTRSLGRDILQPVWPHPVLDSSLTIASVSRVLVHRGFWPELPAGFFVRLEPDRIVVPPLR